jgi:hypothetical protein
MNGLCILESVAVGGRLRAGPACTAAVFAPSDTAGSDGMLENRVLALAGRRAP